MVKICSKINWNFGNIPSYTSEGQFQGIYGLRTNYVIFSDWAETFFWAFQTSWTTKRPITHKSVFLWFCHFVILSFCDCFVSVMLVVSFLCLNIFQSAPNLVQMFLSAIPRDRFFSNFKFLRFLLTFSVFGTSKLNFYGFYGVNGLN